MFQAAPQLEAGDIIAGLYRIVTTTPQAPSSPTTPATSSFSGPWPPPRETIDAITPALLEARLQKTGWAHITNEISQSTSPRHPTIHSSTITKGSHSGSVALWICPDETIVNNMSRLGSASSGAFVYGTKRVLIVMVFHAATRDVDSALSVALLKQLVQ